MNSSGRLFSALQVKEIYRRRARARLERGRRSRAGEVETLQQRRYRACRGRSEGRATASCLAAGRWCDVGGWWVVRGGGGVSTSLLLCVGLQGSSRVGLTLVVVVGSRWSLFLGRGGATRYPEIRRTWQREREG